jgi:hypothetical protein
MKCTDVHRQLGPTDQSRFLCTLVITQDFISVRSLLQSGYKTGCSAV